MNNGSMVDYVKSQIISTIMNNPQQAIGYLFDVFANSPNGKMFFKNINCDISFARKFVIEGGNYIVSNWRNRPAYQLVSAEQLQLFTKNYRELLKLNVLPENELAIVALSRSGLNVMEIKETLKSQSSLEEISNIIKNGNVKVEEKLKEYDIGFSSNTVEQSIPLKHEEIQNIINKIKTEQK